MWRLLTRHGWFWQALARRTPERDEDAGEAVEEKGVAACKNLAATCGTWIVFGERSRVLHGAAFCPPLGPVR
ncbi:helix-turn-helix domain-containing protein [Streptomyces murinus]|uniref:hypothetical protein n=1 Tax=Streptomyces murinus TaxID=33900 RepID=UPI003813C840